MNLQVTLAAYSTPWSFRDSRSLSNWLAELPWVNEGGTSVVRIPETSTTEDYFRLLQQAIRGYDNALTNVKPMVLDESLVEQSFLRAVADGFGLGYESDEDQLMCSLEEAFTGQRTVPIAPPVSAHRAKEILAEVNAFGQELNRGRRKVKLAIVLLDTPEQPIQSDPDHDLMVGAPTYGVLCELHASDRELWRAYVHARLAWESGGNLHRAHEWDGEDFRKLSPGEDGRLEKLLNQRARQAHDALSSTMQSTLHEHLRFLSQSKPTRSEIDEARRQSELLVQAGALWRPITDNRLRPVPWVARALLDRGSEWKDSFLLRGCLVCAPLAHEVLSRCFELESREREKCWAESDQSKAPQDVQRQFQSYQSSVGKLSSPLTFYPKNCPGKPTEAWAIASFGQILNELPGIRRSRERLDLRDLRNSLAHLHFVGWKAIEVLRKVERGLFGSSGN